MFKLKADFQPSGDQPQAIEALAAGLERNTPNQVLLGVTGSGKTFTMANVIARLGRPTLILSHNKTLAAQLYGEFKAFFPDNRVEFFISYYDYYLPESYIPQTDTYIAKDSSTNEQIEKLRLSATSSLVERDDVIVVASVSCIYGLGSPEDYEQMSSDLEVGMTLSRDEFLAKLVSIQYERNDTAPGPGQYRARGDVVDVHSPYQEEFVRVSFWGDQIEKLSRHAQLTGKVLATPPRTMIFPAKHFVLPKERVAAAEAAIMAEMKERVNFFESKGLLVEAQRIYQRTKYDMEMLKEIGYCSGIENYSRHLAGRPPGSRPHCLIDFFPDDFLLFVDESHASIPQLRAMYRADRSRKLTLVEHGFRLPSALDNRPLQFEEFEAMRHRTIFVSATPGDYEMELSGGKPVEQVVRPTGLLDPEIEIRPLEGQVDDLLGEIKARALRHERTLVTTLTKKSAEKLSDYLAETGVRAKYIHSEIDAIERVELLRALRQAQFDCLVGINLLREGLDLPEVSLVAILDADKEGFLRSERALIQVAGRAARNVGGKVLLYADKITDSIKALLSLTKSRRAKQLAYNSEHHITPKTVLKAIRDGLFDEGPTKGAFSVAEGRAAYGADGSDDLILLLEREMVEAATALEFERAAALRDKIKQLREEDGLADTLASELDDADLSAKKAQRRPGRAKQKR